ncbi:hypothetical protein OUZ56_013683 [Daphnia magna]|uniref:Uncharacterized protein n=1 Tax=Daphnia magna TaxID=35525 RepID=A0ABQ9Z6M9_9CRUS|nr:hypothetical protein OUZ56_013683 [Daphnia magna]
MASVFVDKFLKVQNKSRKKKPLALLYVQMVGNSQKTQMAVSGQLAIRRAPGLRIPFPKTLKNLNRDKLLDSA